jgi:Ni/Co efflux regulator RcnB
MRVRVACIVVAALLSPLSAFGDKPGKSKGKSKGQDAQVAVTFTTMQREAAQGYFVEKHGRGGCPPGLAKKENGCLPPGQAKKRYSVGQVLPKGVPTHPPPPELSIRIGAPPAGYTYVVVDGDLVKLAVGTMLVVDAIAGLVQ